MSDSVNEPSVGRTAIYDIFDAYERDRQTGEAKSIEIYLNRSPDPVRRWVLSELLAIEMDILAAQGEAVDPDALRDSAGVPVEEFAEAWKVVSERSARHARASTISRATWPIPAIWSCG